MRQSFRFKCFGGKKLKHLHAVIDVAAEIWNHAVALKNRYYKLFGKGRTLVERFDALAFETLTLEGMRRLWGRKVSDLGFGDFLLKVAWMAGKLGRTFVKIDRFEPTTQTCHGCGHRQGMPLEVRTFVCEACGHTEGRDLNAAKNILEAGRGLRSGAGRKTAARRQAALVTAESHGL